MLAYPPSELQMPYCRSDGTPIHVFGATEQVRRLYYQLFPAASASTFLLGDSTYQEPSWTCAGSFEPSTLSTFVSNYGY